MLRLGYSQADITPDRPMELVGFYRPDNKSAGVLKPLLAQVTVWEAEEKCCLITIDSIGFTRELSDQLRKMIAATLGVTAEKVMLCFSHTHAAPDADREPEYYGTVCDRILGAVRQAAADLTAVSVGWSNAEAKIGVNRRPVSDATDDRIGVIKVCKVPESTSQEGENCDGRERLVPKLLILRVTAHGNVLKRDNNKISPDWFGDLREIAGERFRCPVMVIQGSAGSTAPKYFCSEETPVDATGERYIRSRTALKDMACEVTEAVAKVYGDIKLQQDCSVSMYARHITLSSDVPSNDEAQRIAKEARELCGIADTGWLARVERLNGEGICEQHEDVEMQYWSLGDVTMCGGPYEFMAGFALEAERLTQDEFFYVNGYTNGCLLYFPTEEEFDYGGYEVFWSMLIYYVYIERVYPFRREEASRLIRFITDSKA
ncbi:MAG: alkaline ceramidase [Lachnospiraceae bacterium]|nr:alkaline ceramidase [Lachnospiraceae bacterium]